FVERLWGDYFWECRWVNARVRRWRWRDGTHQGRFHEIGKWSRISAVPARRQSVHLFCCQREHRRPGRLCELALATRQTSADSAYRRQGRVRSCRWCLSELSVVDSGADVTG